MHKLLRATAAVAVTLIASASASAAPRTDCRAQALRDLDRLAPEGHAIYRAITDKRMFLTWIKCDDVQLGLTTAVHESVHMLTEEKDAYPLIDGTAIKRPPSLARFYAPREVAKRFDQGDVYVQTYLRPGAASSSADFTFLLDELNAYSHDLNAAVKLVSLHKGGGQVAHRDGLAALMSFTMAYVDGARSRSSTWEGLQRPEVKSLVQTLWKQAETALASSCNMPGFGRDDRKYLHFMCDSKNAEALGRLIDGQPACPSTCLPSGTASTK